MLKRYQNALILATVLSVGIVYYLLAQEALLWNSSGLPSTYRNKESQANVKNFINEYFTDKADSIQKTNVYLAEKQLGDSSADLDKLKLAIKMGSAFPKNDLQYLHQFFYEIISVFTEEADLSTIPILDTYQNIIDKDRLLNAAFHSEDTEVFTEKFLSSFLKLNKKQIDGLTKSHKAAVSKIDNINLDEILSKYNGKGVVYVGGGKFNWLALMSIKRLRELGSDLPVEVLIPKVSEYEEDYCLNTLPSLNARCILLPQIFGSDVYQKTNFSGYQYKVLAILACSFKDVLLLDADNVPVVKPDELFEEPPYKEFGLVTWPDFWKRTTSPSFFKIAGMKIGKHRSRFGYHQHGIYTLGVEAEQADYDDYENVPLHDRSGCVPDVSTESGQLLVSKETHIKPLLLSLYYNFYGPGFYYPLFSQGSHGEGDKETFVMSSFVFNKPFYQVNTLLQVIGHVSNNEFFGTAMAQFDPAEDYQILKHNVKILSNAKSNFDLRDVKYDKLPKFKSYKEAEKNNYHGLNNAKPRIMFIHANFPKLNPVELKDNNKLIETDSNGNSKRLRLFGANMVDFVNCDLELELWNSMYELLCFEKVKIDAFDKVYTRPDLCAEVTEQLNYLKSTAQ